MWLTWTLVCIRQVQWGHGLLGQLPLDIGEHGRDTGRFGFCPESATCLTIIGKFLFLPEPELLSWKGTHDGPHLIEGYDRKWPD